MHEHVHLPLLSIKTAATSVTILLDFPQTFLPCLMLSINNKNYILWSLDAFIVLQTNVSITKIITFKQFIRSCSFFDQVRTTQYHRTKILPLSKELELTPCSQDYRIDIFIYDIQLIAEKWFCITYVHNEFIWLSFGWNQVYYLFIYFLFKEVLLKMYK